MANQSTVEIMNTLFRCVEKDREVLVSMIDDKENAPQYRYKPTDCCTDYKGTYWIHLHGKLVKLVQCVPKDQSGHGVPETIECVVNLNHIKSVTLV